MMNDQYHPSPFAGADQASERKVAPRLDAMRAHYEFAGKTVLDFGCSGGYFSFSLAQTAAHVTGIDGDGPLIERNREVAESNGVDNVEFHHAVLDEAYVLSDAVPQVDVAIFLSVLHHVIATSERYEFNAGLESGVERGVALLAAMRAKTSVLFFEIGQYEEDTGWAKSMPDMGDDPAAWIRANLLEPAGFTSIETIDPPAWEGLRGSLLKLLHTRGRILVRPSSGIVGRVVRKFSGYDTRDCRFLFKASG